MSEKTFMVVCLSYDSSVKDIVDRAARLIKCKHELIEKLLKALPYPIKRNVSYDVAQKHQKSLYEVGIYADVIPEERFSVELVQLAVESVGGWKYRDNNLPVRIYEQQDLVQLNYRNDCKVFDKLADLLRKASGSLATSSMELYDSLRLPCSIVKWNDAAKNWLSVHNANTREDIRNLYGPEAYQRINDDYSWIKAKIESNEMFSEVVTPLHQVREVMLKIAEGSGDRDLLSFYLVNLLFRNLIGDLIRANEKYRIELNKMTMQLDSIKKVNESLHQPKSKRYIDIINKSLLDMRKLHPCKSCGHMVSFTALECPSCGQTWPAPTSIFGIKL